MAGNVSHKDHVETEYEENNGNLRSSYDSRNMRHTSTGSPQLPYTMINGHLYTESAAQLKLLAQLNVNLIQYYPQDIFL